MTSWSLFLVVQDLQQQGATGLLALHDDTVVCPLVCLSMPWIPPPRHMISGQLRPFKKLSFLEKNLFVFFFQNLFFHPKLFLPQNLFSQFCPFFAFLDVFCHFECSKVYFAQIFFHLQIFFSLSYEARRHKMPPSILVFLIVSANPWPEWRKWCG